MQTLVLTCLLFTSVAAQQPKPLPQFSLRQLNGKTVRSEEFKDNIVVLDFWATWCGPCVAEIPAFNRLHAKYRARGVRVIGVAVQSGWPSDVRKFMAAGHRMRYTVLVGHDQTVADFDAIGFPTTYVISPGWKVFKKYSGSEGNNPSLIERDIEILLKAK